jgi:ferredoxin-NADP reductase
MSQSQAPVMSEFEAEAVVSGFEVVADDVVLLTLSPADASVHLPSWTPGAHLDLLLGDGLVRQYSLCGPTVHQDSYQVAVLRAPDSRGGSKAVHELQEGSRLRIRGPRNHFPLVISPRYVFVAGGIGITPMLPMIEEAEATGADWVLHYGGRTSGSMAFRERLAQYGDRVHLVPQPSWTAPPQAPWSTAAGPSHSSRRWRSCATAGLTSTCTSSASRRRNAPTRARTPASRWCCSARGSRCGSSPA